MIEFVEDDGGRAAAGYKGEAGDCAVRAIAIATGGDYQMIYDSLNAFAKQHERRGKKGSSSRTGVYSPTMRRYMEQLGWEWVPTMFIGTGCRVHLREDELPAGRIVVNLSKHYAAVIDRVLHDTHRCDRDGTRCVYGYWLDPHERMEV